MMAPVIALVGVDGAGKSSVALEIKNILSKKGYTCEIIYMGRGRDRALPGARDTMKKFGLNPPGKDDILTMGLMKKHMMIIMRDISYLLDTFSRYIKFILPAKKNNNIIITDRYAYDIVLNRETKMITKFILRYLYPAPRFTFFLHNDPEILFDRKKEQSVEELQRQMDELRDMLNWKFKGKNNYWKIRTTSLNQTVEFILDKIQPELSL